MKNFILIAGIAILSLATVTACKSDTEKSNKSGGIPSQLFTDPVPGVDLELFDIGAPLQAQHHMAGIVFDSILRAPIKDTSWIPGYASQLSQKGCLVYKPSDNKTYIGQSGSWQQLLYLSDALTLFKKNATYSGTTNSSGVYTVTFASAYPVAPNIQANIVGGTDSQIIRITSITTTGFTVTVRNRTDIVGLLPTWSNVNGANVDVLITQK